MEIVNAEEIKTRRWRRICQALGGLLIFEVAALVWLYATVPQLPVAEHDLAKAQQEQVETELGRLQLARQEDEHPVEAMSAMLTFKPQNVGLVKVSIGKQGNGDYLCMMLQSDSEQAVRDYVASLSANDFFRTMRIANIQAENGSCTAEVVARREAER